jgi:predicted SnoaL-like aldol condensation-catalyzing enzyme
MKTGIIGAGHIGDTAQEEKNMQSVINALDTLFNKRDYESTRKLWSPDYVQRSLWVPPGKDGLFNMVPTIPPTMRLEFDHAVGNDDVVFVHCRTTGQGAPPFVSGDWFRIKDGLFIEHWDVMQNEVSEKESLSKRPMYGAAAMREPNGPGRSDIQRQNANKALAIEAFDTLFNKRDFAAATKYWSPQFVQHSALTPPGREGLFNQVKSTPKLRYEFGLAMASQNLVVLHGRITGNGKPRADIVANILQLQDGVFVEHWDVVMPEATREEANGRSPMWGDTFPA